MKRLLVCLLVVLCAGGPASGAGPVRKVLLKNGFRLITAPDTSLPLVGLSLGLGAGPAQEDDTTGGASQLLGLSLLELPEGHRLRAKWAKAVELSGADTAVTASKDTTLITLQLPTELVDTALEVLAERLREPGAALFRVDEIKANLLRKLSDRAAQPLTSGRLGELFESLAYARHPYARSPEGTPDAVRALNREKLMEFQKRWWAPNNMVLTLSGDVDPEKTLARVQELFGTVPAAPLVRAAPPEVTLPDAPRKEVLELPVEGTAVQVGWIGPPASDPDIWPMRLLRAVLAEGRLSRLRRRLMDRGGRVVRIDSDWQFLPQSGVLMVELGLSSPDLWPVIDDLVSEVERLRRTELGAEELTRVKTFLAAQNGLRVEDKASHAERLTGFELIDDVYTAESYVSLLEQVTAAQVKQAAVKWLDPARVIVAAIRPRSGPAASALRTESFALPAGLTLAVRSRPGSESIGVCALVRTGTGGADPRKAAAATLGASAIGGTRRHSADDIAVRLESLGTKLRVQAQDGYFTLQLNATDDTLDDVLSSLREILVEPSLPPAELARSRTHLAAELREKLSDDDVRGHVELLHEVFSDRPAAAAQADPEIILKLGSEEMAQWLAETLVPSRTVISISSSMPPEKVRELVAAKFAGWNAPGAPAPAAKPLAAFEGRAVRTVAQPPGRPSDLVFLAFRLPPETNKDFAAVTVCVRALGIGKQSLIARRMAKVDPTYQPTGIRYMVRAEGGVVMVSYRVEQGRARAALKAVDEAIGELADPGPPAGDVADTRDFVLNLFLKEQQSRVAEAGSLAVATGMLADPRFFADAPARYKALTPADVKRAAGWFQPYRAVVCEAAAK